MKRQKRPKVVEALGQCRGFERYSTKNLQDLHCFLVMSLIDADFEMRRRGLGSGKEISIRTVDPE
jgi:hypothetical protein